MTSAKLEAVWPRALRLDGAVRDPNALHMMMLERCIGSVDDFDVLHFHLDYYPFSLFSRQATPFVTTLHGRLDLPEHQPVFDTFTTMPVVSISNAAPAAAAGELGRHGAPRPAGTLLTPQPASRPISPSWAASRRKKASTARSASPERCGIPLKIAAKVDRADHAYFEEQMRPLIAPPQFEFIGEINDAQKPNS